jgi:4-amino-4-deoxy-L-arabinose transferase-like glycosyltransferase
VNWLRRHGAFIGVLCLTLAWRLYFAMHWPIVQISDYRAYYDEARQLAGLTQGTYTALYAWGPKLLYSFPMRLAGDDLRVLGATNAILYTLSLLFLYAGARRIFGGAVATLATVICLVSLSEVYFTSLAATEVPGTFFMSAIFWLMTYETTPRVLAALGVTIGIASYNRSNMLVFPGLIFLYEAARTRRFWIPLRKAAIVQGIAVIAILPLCFLNQHYFGRFSPVIANSAQLWWGNNPRLSGDFHTYPPTPEDFPPGSAERQKLVREYSPFYVNPDPSMDFRTMKPHDVSSVRVRYAIGWIRQNPVRYLQLIKARVVLLFWSCTYGEVAYQEYDPNNPQQPRWRPAHERLIARARLPIRSLYRVLISMAMFGAVLTFVRRRGDVRVALPLMIVAWYSVPFLLTAAANRYKIPVLGLCWIYIASGLLMIVARFSLASTDRARMPGIRTSVPW